LLPAVFYFLNYVVHAYQYKSTFTNVVLTPC
jgi:hypothetical protein